MQGVEILNATNTLIGMGAILTILLIFLFAGFVAWFFVIDDEDEKRKAFVGIFISAICAIVVSNINTCTLYDVVIDETVNFNEFTEKYKIIDTKGKIYSVIEREDSDDNNFIR